MIKYLIKIGSVLISNTYYPDSEDPPEGVYPDLIELQISHGQTTDGQQINIVLDNIKHKFTGQWVIEDIISIQLIDEGYTASADSDKPVLVYRDVFPICKGIVQRVEYDLYNVRIQGGIIEDDLASSYIKEDLVFDKTKVSEAVKKVLDAFEGIQNARFEGVVIKVINDVNVMNTFKSGSVKIREILDYLALLSGCEWWIEYQSSTDSSIFHFEPPGNSISGERIDYSDKITLPSYGLNKIGYVNRAVVIAGGNDAIQAPNPGSEIMDTIPIRAVMSDYSSETAVYRAPTIVNQGLLGKNDAEAQARAIVMASSQTDLNLANPEFIGIAPALTEFIAYKLGDYASISQGSTVIYGTVIAKRIEFSASGWKAYITIAKKGD